MKIRILLCLFGLLSFYSFSAEAGSVGNEALYKNEKIEMTTTERFDKLFNSPIKDFVFYKGGVVISKEDFKKTVDDPEFLKLDERIKRVKEIGFGSTAFLGGLSFAFMIPSIYFVASNVMWKYNYSANKSYDSYIDYYNARYADTILPGLICIVLSGLFFVASLIDLGCTFALLHKYANNELFYRDVIDRYNRKLKVKYGLLPEVSFDVQSGEGKCGAAVGFRFN